MTYGGFLITVLATSDAWALLKLAFGLQITSLTKSNWALLNTNYLFFKLEIFVHDRLNTGYSFSQTIWNSLELKFIE